MPRKKRVGRPRKHRGDGIKDVIRKIHNFVKGNKLISRAGKALGDAGVPYAGRVGEVASHLGYGRKKKRHRRRRT